MRWIDRILGLSAALVVVAMLAAPRHVTAADKPKDAPKSPPGAGPKDPGTKEAAAPTVADLRPRFVAGRKSRFEIWTLRKETSTITGLDDGPQSSKSTLDIKGEITWTVEKVRSDGGASCVMTIDWITADVTDDEGAVEHNDTRKTKGETEGLYDMFKAMAGVPLRFEVSPLGTIEKVAGVDVIKKNAGENVEVPEELDFIETASDLATLPGAPEAELAPGKGWDIAYDWTHEYGTMHHDTHYTLSGVEVIAGIPVATVTGRSTPKLNVDKTKLPEGALPADIRLTAGTSDTQVMWDLQRHEAVGRNTVDTRTIEIKSKLADSSIAVTTSETIQNQTLRISEE